MASKTEDESPKFLRDYAQRLVMNDIIRFAGGWMIMILDEDATKIISPLMGMFDLMESRVTLVENLNKKRQPFRDLDAIYVMSPVESSISKLLDDFRNPKGPIYHRAHLFFLTQVPDGLFRQLRDTPQLISRVKSLREINFDFLAVENSCFHLDLPLALKSLYGEHTDISICDTIARKLSTLCVTLNEFPIIRFQSSSRYPGIIANSLQNELSVYSQRNPTWSWIGRSSSSGRERGVLLICDRVIDILSVLTHQYSYQCMMADFLPDVNGNITYSTETNSGQSVTKLAMLNDDDDIWTELRHDHIARVIQVLSSRMQEFSHSNVSNVLVKSAGSSLSIEDMAKAVKQLPEFREIMSRLSLHISLARDMMAEFNSQEIMDLSKLEQICATGLNDEGRLIARDGIIQITTEYLTSHPNLPLDNKLRLICIVIVGANGVCDEELNRLTTAGRLSAGERLVVQNLSRISIPLNLTAQQVAQLQQNSISKQEVASKDRSNRSGASLGLSSSMFGGLFSRTKKDAKSGAAAKEEMSTASSDDLVDVRYLPKLRDIAERIISNDLSTADFPPVAGAVVAASNTATSTSSSVRSVRNHAKSSAYSASVKQATSFSGGRIIMFVAGGISQAEMRSLYELMRIREREIVMGSTSILSPKQFIQDVNQLDDASLLRQMQFARQARQLGSTAPNNT